MTPPADPTPRTPSPLDGEPDRPAARSAARLREYAEDAIECGDRSVCVEPHALLAVLDARGLALAELAEAAREINVAGPVAHRIRVLKRERDDALNWFESARETAHDMEEQRDAAESRASALEERVRELEAAVAKVYDLREATWRDGARVPPAAVVGIVMDIARAALTSPPSHSGGSE